MGERVIILEVTVELHPTILGLTDSRAVRLDCVETCVAIGSLFR